MGQTTDELTSDIDNTRDSLARDLDELQDRVSPSAIMDRRKEAARSRVRSLRDKVMGDSQSDASSSDKSLTDNASQSARDAADRTQSAMEGSPLAAGLIAFGAGLVVAALIPASQAEVRASKKVVDAAQEHGQPLIEEAKAVGQDSAENLKSSATEAAEQVKSSAQDSAQRVKDEGASSADTVKQDAPGGS